MKRIAYLIAALSAITFASCQKVIDVKVENATPQYVIEGSITNAAGPYNVHISRSTELNKHNEFPAVSNATVIVTDDMGNNDTLQQMEPGNYQTRTIRGIPGHAYTVKVFVDGQTFYATSEMPKPVTIDSIYTTRERHMGEEGTYAAIVYNDPAGVHNYYHFRIFKNGIQTKQLYIMDDQFIDGQLVKQSFADADSSYSGNDNIRIELQSISKELYEYFYSLQQTMMQSSATPANPIRQIKGGNVLGYFSAHTVSEKSIVVP